MEVVPVFLSNRNIFRWRHARIFYDEMLLKMAMSWEMNGTLYWH